MPLLVNKRAPFGLNEFAQLYANEGATPMDAASNIHLNYPMEAKSVLDTRWKALGIPTTPERFFSATPSSPSVIADRNPTFANEAERNLAIATGAYDPSFASPAARANSMALEAIASRDRASIRSRAAELAPLEAATPATLMRSQLAGDVNGLAKKLLIKKAGMAPEDYYSRTGGELGPMDLIAGTVKNKRPQLEAYTPGAGYGRLSGTNMPSRLDSNIYFDSDFQEALRRDPEGAAFTYQRLTGRELGSDLGETLETRKTQLKVGRDYATRALTEGATRDPITGKWKVWNISEMEPSGLGGLGAAPRPARQLVDATPEQADWLDNNYEAITGRQAIDMRDTPRDARVREATLQRMQNVPAFQGMLALTRKRVGGRELTAKELVMLANDATLAEMRAKSVPSATEKGLMDTAAFVRNLLGMNPDTGINEWAPVHPVTPIIQGAADLPGQMIEGVRRGIRPPTLLPGL